MSDENANNDEPNYEPLESLELQAPIVGYEVVEARKRFTVYQISITLADGRNWFVFRRYSDFARMDENLRKIFVNDFPDCSLPPKRLLGDNFAGDFIDTRKDALQQYLDKILAKQDMAVSQPVVEFLCLDEPPGPYDSLEESRAFIGSLEEAVGDLKTRQNDLRTELKIAKAQLRQAQGQRHALLVALRAERVLNGKPSYDDDDIALISDYSGHPEVKSLDLTKFGKDEDTRSTRGRSWRCRLSTTGSQWDLTVESSDGSHRPSTLYSSLRATSTPDITKSLSASHRRRTKHLPSDNATDSGLSILDKFMRQSTEALHQIRQSVRQKLGNWENETDT